VPCFTCFASLLVLFVVLFCFEAGLIKEQYIAGKILMRSFQRTINHQNPPDGRKDIRILRLVANGLVEGASRLQTVVAQSILVGINWFLRQTKEQNE